jgi:hypothetical protein
LDALRQFLRSGGGGHDGQKRREEKRGRRAHTQRTGKAGTAGEARTHTDKDSARWSESTAPPCAARVVPPSLSLSARRACLLVSPKETGQRNAEKPLVNRTQQRATQKRREQAKEGPTGRRGGRRETGLCARRAVPATGADGASDSPLFPCRSSALATPLCTLLRRQQESGIEHSWHGMAESCDALKLAKAIFAQAIGEAALASGGPRSAALTASVGLATFSRHSSRPIADSLLSLFVDSTLVSVAPPLHRSTAVRPLQSPSRCRCHDERIRRPDGRAEGAQRYGGIQ